MYFKVIEAYATKHVKSGHPMVLPSFRYCVVIGPFCFALAIFENGNMTISTKNIPTSPVITLDKTGEGPHEWYIHSHIDYHSHLFCICDDATEVKIFKSRSAIQLPHLPLPVPSYDPCYVERVGQSDTLPEEWAKQINEFIPTAFPGKKFDQNMQKIEKSKMAGIGHLQYVQFS